MGYFTDMPAFLDLPSTVDPEERRKIDSFLGLLEDSGIGPIILSGVRSGTAKGGRPPSDYCHIFAAVLYAFAFSKATLRDIESLTRFDLRFAYITRKEVVDHVTVGRLIRNVVAPNARAIFAALTSAILSAMGIDGREIVYVDGTKIEANANRYKFVWKPLTFHRRLSATANAIIAENRLIEGYEPEELIRPQTVALALSKAAAAGAGNGVARALEAMLAKALEYEEKERTCGPGRKSYYKTDRDATAMALKADYYAGLGSNMRAAYNVQVAVSGGIPVGYVVSQARNDIGLLREAVESCRDAIGGLPEAVCADAGYGSLDAYRFLEERGIRSFVKHQSWEGNASGRNPDCYAYDGGRIVCLNGLEALPAAVPGRHPKRAGGTFVEVTGCLGCPFSDYCRRFQGNPDPGRKVFEVVEELERLKAASHANLLSVEGIEARVNRAIQAEGVFGELKQNMGFWRFRRRGLEGASAEVMLCLLGCSLRKYHAFLATGKPPARWTAPEGTEPQRFRKPSPKRLAKKAARIRAKMGRRRAGKEGADDGGS